MPANSADGAWPKECLCGKRWAREEWAELVFIGHADGAEDGELELRNCTCGSTLAVRRGTTAPLPQDP